MLVSHDVILSYVMEAMEESKNETQNADETWNTKTKRSNGRTRKKATGEYPIAQSYTAHFLMTACQN